MPTVCIVKLEQDKSRRSIPILSFDLRLQWDWLLDFHQEKGRLKPHENVHLGLKEGKKCKWHCMQQMRKETVHWCYLCNIHLCKDGCHIAYHNQQHYALSNFFLLFGTSIDISPKLFMSIVRLIWHSYKSFLDCLSQLFNTCPLDFYDGWGGLSHLKLKQVPPSQLLGPSYPIHLLIGN